MKPKRILLTGDDGYNSIGIRLLINALKDDYELRIAATKHQQSGVGGSLTLDREVDWGETTIDGVPAIWIDGSPTDAVGLAQGYFDRPFDLILSGINLGINASSAIISSGTYSAAIRGMGIKVAPRAIVLSWVTTSEFWQKKHDEKEDLTPYFDYPGGVLKSLFEKIFTEEMWGVDLLNINFPARKTNQVKFTKIYKDITKVFTHPLHIDREKHRFSYKIKNPFQMTEKNLRYDIGALNQGYITITPCTTEMTHFTTFEKLEKTELEL